jgi:L-serine/L-threonine ammonia-lyase
MPTNGIYVETPLIYSKYLSDIASKPVYLKLENTQPSGSFKMRGLSQQCIEKVAEGCTKLVGSSGGNAGLALAYAAFKLGVPCQIFVPTYVSTRMLNKIRAYGTEVTITGHDWQAADTQARALAANNKEIGYIHPFDHSAVWAGNSTMVTEIQEQLNGVKPSCVATSVGGGGLLVGVLQGLERVGWKDVPVLAMETVGAECFNKSLKAGKIVEIELTSLAKTLGARAVTTTLMEMCSEFNIISKVLPDEDAVKACLRFADDHAFLVELSCGVTLAALYSGLLPSVLEESKNGSVGDGPIVLIVCGGSDTTPDILQEFAQMFEIPTV